MKVLSLLVLSVFGAVSICDKYTTALFDQNTGENQFTLVRLVVNTAVIGNYTQPNLLNVPGILTPGSFKGESIELLKYFTGMLDTTNVNNTATRVNFLDGGAAAAIVQNNMDVFSNQFTLMKNLYDLFGMLLGCSMQMNTYSGDVSMYETHKFMKLTKNEIGYFIEQVGISALSFGVSIPEVSVITQSLHALFNSNCEVIASLGGMLPEANQSICVDCQCDLSSDKTEPQTTTSVNSAITISIKLASIVMLLCML